MEEVTQENRDTLRRLYGDSIDLDKATPDDLKRYILALEGSMNEKLQMIDKLLTRSAKYDFYLEKMIAVAQGKDE